MSQVRKRARSLQNFFRNHKPQTFLFLLLVLSGYLTHRFWNSKTFVLMSATLAITLYLGWLRMRTSTLNLIFDNDNGEEEISIEPKIYDLDEVKSYAENKAKDVHPPSRGGLVDPAAVTGHSSERLQKYYIEWIEFMARMYAVLEINFELQNCSSIEGENIELTLGFPNSWNLGRATMLKGTKR